MALYRGTDGGILRSLLGGVAGAESCCDCDYECTCAPWIFTAQCNDGGLTANIVGQIDAFSGTLCAGEMTWGYDAAGSDQGTLLTWTAGGLSPSTYYVDFDADAQTPPTSFVYIRVTYSGSGTGLCDVIYEVQLDCEPPP